MRQTGSSADTQFERTRKLAVANSILESDNSDLAAQMQGLKAQRTQIEQEIVWLGQAASAGKAAITEAKIARFAETMHATVANPDPAFRKAYLRLFVDKIIVGDASIELSVPRAALSQAAALNELPSAGTMVPSFVREWRPVRDETENWNLLISLA